MKPKHLKPKQKRKGLDDLDLAIIAYLKQDSRRSLKELAKQLKKRVSTVYNRFNRLQLKQIVKPTLIVNLDPMKQIPNHYKYNQGGFCVNCGNAGTEEIPTIKIYDWYPDSGNTMPKFHICKACFMQMAEGWQ